jgi:hypothetical protein
MQSSALWKSKKDVESSSQNIYYIRPMKKPKLTQDQIEQLDNLISETILHALQEDGICEPDMSDMDEEDDCYDDCYEDRMNVLYVEAIKYLKNNID